MPKIIEPDNPEELKAFLSQNKAPENPLPSPTVPEGPPPNNQSTDSAAPALSLARRSVPDQQPAANVNPIIPQPPQSNLGTPAEPRRKRRGIVKLIVLSFIVIVAGLLIWHFWATPNKKSGNTITGKSNNTTLVGANSQSATQNSTPSPTSPINIPAARQTYSIENGGFKYTFKFLKGAQTPKGTNAPEQDVVAPAGPDTIFMYVKPAAEQKELACENDGSGDFTLKTVKVLGQDYPLCAENEGSSTISNSYTLRFLYLGQWHEFFVGNATNQGFFSDQLALDILSSLKVEKS